MKSGIGHMIFVTWCTYVLFSNKTCSHTWFGVNSCVDKYGDDYMALWFGFTFSLIIIPLEKHHKLPCYSPVRKLGYKRMYVYYLTSVFHMHIREFINKMISLIINYFLYARDKDVWYYISSKYLYMTLNCLCLQNWFVNKVIKLVTKLLVYNINIEMSHSF